MTKMAKTTLEYSGNEIPMFADEGDYTASDKDVRGGAFASPLDTPGTFVKFVTGKEMTVVACANGDTPIGFTVGAPVGKLQRYGRAVTVKLFCDYSHEFQISSTSEAIAVGDPLKFAVAGVPGKFIRSEDGSHVAVPTHIVALQARAKNTGVDTDTIYAMVGKFY